MRLFQKGLQDQNIAGALKQAIAEGDCNEIATTIKLAGCERIPVDTFVAATPRIMRPPRQVLNTPMDSNPEYGTEEFIKELQMLFDLHEMIDEPLSSVPLRYPRGLRLVSKYLANKEVPKYESGKDYMTNKRSWQKVQDGKKILCNPKSEFYN